MQKIIKLSITPFLSSPSDFFGLSFFVFTFLTFSIFFVVLFGPHCLNQLYYLGVLLMFLMLTTSYFSDFFYQGICFDFEKPVMQTFE